MASYVAKFEKDDQETLETQSTTAVHNNGGTNTETINDDNEKKEETLPEQEILPVIRHDREATCIVANDGKETQRAVVLFQFEEAGRHAVMVQQQQPHPLAQRNNMHRKYGNYGGAEIFIGILIIIIAVIVSVGINSSSNSNTTKSNSHTGSNNVIAPNTPSSGTLPGPINSAATPVASTLVRKEQLSVACDFLLLTNMSECLATTRFETTTTSPTIPTELGSLTQLTYLSLVGNELTGTIPSTFNSPHSICRRID